LAYTSVATVLGRLQTKGLVERMPVGTLSKREANRIIDLLQRDR